MTILRSLRGRLGLVYAAAALVMVAAILSFVLAVVEGALVRSTAERLEIEAGLVAADAGGPRGPRATDLAASDLASVLGGRETAVVILDAGGRTLAEVDNGAPPDVVSARLAADDYATVVTQERTVDRVRDTSQGRVLVVAAPIQLRATGNGNPGANPGNGNGRGNGNGLGRGLGNTPPGLAGNPGGADGPANAVAQLAISLDAVDVALADLRWRVGLVGLGVLAAAVGLVWLLTAIGLRPLGRVAAAADRIAAGDLDARAGLPDGPDEVGRLGRAFDGMAERVDATVRGQRQFAADASHELRTPLTVLGGYVDVLARAGDDRATSDQTLAAMRREIDRLSRLSSDLLLLTQLEAGGGRLAPRPFNLRELVDDIAGAARVIAGDRTVDLHAADELPVVGDPDRLTQALMNLVDNAIRHTPPGGRIGLAASRSGSTAVVAVANEGAPIPARQLARVFDRFYRAAPGMAAEDGPHAGLGLAIVKAIVEASGGQVVAASDAGGTTFTIRLPLVPVQALLGGSVPERPEASAPAPPG